jgi:hypothetical protein
MKPVATPNQVCGPKSAAVAPDERVFDALSAQVSATATQLRGRLERLSQFADRMLGNEPMTKSDAVPQPPPPQSVIEQLQYHAHELAQLSGWFEVELARLERL